MFNVWKRAILVGFPVRPARERVADAEVPLWFLSVKLGAQAARRVAVSCKAPLLNKTESNGLAHVTSEHFTQKLLSCFFSAR